MGHCQTTVWRCQGGWAASQAGCQHTGHERLEVLPGLKMRGLGGDHVLHTARDVPLRPQRGGIELHHKDTLWQQRWDPRKRLVHPNSLPEWQHNAAGDTAGTIGPGDPRSPIKAP